MSKENALPGSLMGSGGCKSVDHELLQEDLMKIDVNLLHGRWVHAREEDSATEHVYRPANFPLPPARGRSGLQFDADGTFKRIGIGATDISNVQEGAWQIDRTKPDGVCVDVGGESQRLEIKDLEPDRMTIKRAT